MKNVPRQFAFTEHPNPLADVGLAFEDQKDTGYPVSLQFTHLMMINIAQATMKLYEGKGHGAAFQRGAEVECWCHTPEEPLLKRMVLRNAVFVIPKAVLKSKQTYQAVVTLVPERKLVWTFTTGSQMQGLRRLK